MTPDTIEVLIVFAFLLSMLAMILGQIRWRARHKLKVLERESPTLAQSELKTLIREAVTEATQPLAERIEHLEEVAQMRTPPLLSLDEPEAEAGQEPAAQRRRVT